MDKRHYTREQGSKTSPDEKLGLAALQLAALQVVVLQLKVQRPSEFCAATLAAAVESAAAGPAA